MDLKEVVDINKRIENMVKPLPENYYATKEEISFFNRFHKCDDFILSYTLINDIWEILKGEFINYSDEGDKQVPSPVSVLHTNSGAGKFLDVAPENSVITSFNTNYVCKRVCDFVCQDRNEKGMYYSYDRDISQYFALCNTNSSKKYNIVVTQPNEDMDFYKSIDFSKEMGDLSPVEYYVARGAHFVNENGYLVLIYTPNKDLNIKELEMLSGMKMVYELQDNDLEYLSYEAIIFKKY